MRLRSMATALALMMAMPAVAHAETWAHWKRHHPVRLGPALTVDPDHVTTALLRALVRWEGGMHAAESRVRQAWLLHERAQGHFVDPTTMRSWSAAGVDALIVSVFGHNGEALHVADCESHDNPYAHNPSGASGVFQLMPEWWAGRFDPFDPVANVRAAYRISNGGTNWGGWLCA